MSRIEQFRTDHLILLVGTNPLPVYVAARLLARKHVYLFYSHAAEEAGIPSTKKYADFIKRELEEHVLSCQCLGLHDVDRSKIAGTVQSTLNALKKSGQPGSESIGINYTGATKPMSLHAYDAVRQWASENKTPTVCSYLDPRRLALVVDAPRQGTYPIPRAKLQLDLETIIALHGYRLKPGTGRREVSPARLQLARAIAGIYSTPDTAQRAAWDAWHRDSQELGLPDSPDLAALIEVMRQICAAGGQLYSDEGLARALGPHAQLNSYRKWFKGTWLEELAHNALTSNPSVQEAIAGVEPEPQRPPEPGESSPKFELDVAATVGYQLFAIACTTMSKKDSMTKKHLMQAYIRAQELGGEEARVAFVCLVDNPELLKLALQEEWHIDRQVQVFGLRDLAQLDNKISYWITEQGQA